MYFCIGSNSARNTTLLQTAPRSIFLTLVLSVLCVLGATISRADHFSGASITYECTGGGMYNVYLDLYLDCAGTAITPQTLNFTNDCGVSFSIANLLYVSEQEVSPLCNAALPNSTCNGGTLPGFRWYRFQTSLFLSPCDAWTISWSICCRNTMENIAGTPGTYVEATLNNANGICDASPVFADSGIPYICLGNDLLYSPGATDPDGNTMQFALIDARFNAPPPMTVNYLPGYTGAEPLPGMTIDPNTGQLNFEPTEQGNYTVVVQVSTYDPDGNLIGTVMRDLMFVAVACNGTPPITPGLSNATGGAMITGPNSIEVCDGENFCVDLEFTDEELNNVVSLFSNATTQLPGATFQVNGTNPVIATICWVADTAVLPLNVYVQADDGDCPIMNIISTSLLIAPAVDPPTPPNAGQDGSTTACPGGPAIDLFTFLGGTPNANGTWIDPDGNAHSGTFTPGTDPFGDYTYTVGSACENASAIVTITDDANNAAGTDGTLTICTADAAVDLFNSLGGSPAVGGNWTGPLGPMNGTYDPAAHDPGVYTYTLVGGPCPGASATVIVNEIISPYAGMDGVVDLCTSSPVTDLFALLGAAAQPGGTWSGPSAITGNYSPALHEPGDYEYTVTGDPACASSSATLTVNEYVAPDAGMNANLTVCEGATPVDLIDVLNGAPQPGGVWTGPAGVMEGIYDPAIHDPGNYGYTITGTPPCANSTAWVIVSEVAAPNAGTDASVQVCSNEGAIDLFSQLGGTPAANGTWSGPSAITGVYDPALHLPGDYVYTVNGPASCQPATATVSVSLIPAPDAGTMGNITICNDAAPVDLFTVLNGTPQSGGTWSGPSTIDGNFDPAIHVEGIYIYTVAGADPCAAASATVTVDVQEAANAGADASIDVCSSDAAVDLFALLGVTAQTGGTWSGPDAIDGTYDPAANAPGAYVYTVAGANGCADASATITVNEFVPADAGSDVTLEICSDAAPIDLLSQLNGTPQGGGAWSGPSEITGTFDPALHAEGIYSYTVTGSAACPDAVASIDITVTPAADAGSDGTLSICATDAPADLFNALGGAPQPGGTWSGPGAIDGTYDPSSDVPGAYMYSIPGNGSCAGSSAMVVVTEALPVFAGNDTSIQLCSSAAPLDLFDALGGSAQSGGTWSGPSPLSAGIFDPAIHQAGDYVYTITGTAPCPSASATVTVDLEEAADAGADGSITLCNASAAVDLFTMLGGDPQPGGTWSGPSVITGYYDPAIHEPGVYTYSIAGGTICTGASASVTVVETGSPNAGNDMQISFCSSDAPVDLFTFFNGSADPGGEWSGPAGSFVGVFDPSADPEGIYTYSIDAVAPCVSDEALITITVYPAPDAGTDGAITVCQNGGANNLFSSLGGSPQPGGTWSGPSGAFDGMFDPSIHDPGNYTYTINGSAPCGSSSAVVVVTETGSPNAGTDALASICPDATPVDLFSLLGGSPDAGGSWSGPSPDMNGSFDPSLHLAGVYTYTIDATAPCVSDASTVTVEILEGADAGEDASVAACSSGGILDLFDQLGGTPQAGGSWSGPSPIDGNFDPASHAAGTYVYTVDGSGSCGSASAEVVVSITSDPDAGEDALLAICSSGTVTDLFTVLGGTSDMGGSWSGPVPNFSGQFDPSIHPSGTYTYTIDATAPCVADQAIVSVSVEAAPDPGTSAEIEICSSAEPQDLLSILGGSAGGSWSGPSQSFNGDFDPAIHQPGTYTYTLTGSECADASASVEVSVLPGADAGADSAIDLCSTDQAVDLIAALEGSPDQNGTWTDPSGNATTATLDPTTAQSGTYTYTVAGSGDCPAAVAQLQVAISAAPQAGIGGTLDMCSDEGQVSLFDGLSGTLDAGGTWTDPNGQPHASLIDPLIDVAGTYTYTVTNGSCAPASSVVNVVIYSLPDAGESSSIMFCTNQSGATLMSLLEGDPDPNGTWTGPDGSTPAAMFLPGSSAPGIYTYTVQGNAACGTDSATVTIAISEAANAGTNGSITLCQNDAPMDLFTLIGGSPDANGSWLAPDGSDFNGSFDPATQPGGNYTYTIEPDAPCAAVSSIVIVDLLPVPNPVITATNSDACAPVEVTILHDFAGSASCTWIIGNGEFSQDCGPITTTFEEAGSYDVTLIIDAGNGCGANTVQAVELVNVFDEPVAAFEALPEAIGTQNPTAYFHNYSEGASTYMWEMGGTGTYSTEHVNHLFPGELADEYDVCLIAYASPQCADTICKVVTVGDALELHVPNAFTPDGDGINDLFQPVVGGVDPDRYQFIIFDRWGAEIFATTDPDASWNGLSSSGEEFPQGVYAWKLHMKDPYSGDRVERIGHVTLVR